MAQSALVSSARKVFLVPYQKGLSNILPEAKPMEHPRLGRMLIIPHTIETTRLARNFGVRVPAPILTQYDWCGDTPFKTQRTTAAMLTMNTRAFVLSEMGTGKTRAALHALAFMLAEGIIKNALIVAPLSTLSLVWGREILAYFPHLSAGILHGTKARRLKVLGEKHDIYVINHDGVEVIADEIVGARFDAMVIDEIATFRNQRATRWKVLNRVVRNCEYVWGLTGSPTPNEPTDAYAQVKLLNPSRVPAHFSHFKKETMRQITQFIWLPKDDANDKVFEAMQPAVRFKRDDCVELPPVSYAERKVGMSAEQSDVYKRLMTKLRVSFEAGEVTAANEGVLFSKLLQISAGWVYTSDKKVIDLNPRPRLDALNEVLDEASSKVIVFAEFIHVAHNIMEDIYPKHMGSLSLVTGATPKPIRDRIFSDFQNAKNPRILVAHPKCMAHGLTLTAASTIVWYTPTTSLETYEQACARITRPGQKSKQLIVHLTGSKIEAKLYKRLQQKAGLQGALLELFEE